MHENLIKVEITTADLTGLLQLISCERIALYHLIQSGELSVSFYVSESDLTRLETIAARHGDSIKILNRSFLQRIFLWVIRRPVFIIGMTLLLILAIYLPTRVLFICVEGNAEIPLQLLIEKANESGICFGASRKTVRSEQVKNSLLNHIPQLQWVGVNTYGCVAVISVEEKSPEIEIDETNSVSSIVSSQDGIIMEVTVRSGNTMCHVGQAVQEGQLLVSGYTDCGLKVQAEHADAEILAQTIRKMDMIAPVKGARRVAQHKITKKFMLQIGKNLIKLNNDSGISDSTCVKMYTKKYMELPGGFHLPIALITVEYIYYTTVTENLTHEQGSAFLRSIARRYLLAQMAAGSILYEDTVLISEDGCYRLVGEYICTEMIGKTIHEESFYTNGKDH